jgi:hypothetical protein
LFLDPDSLLYYRKELKRDDSIILESLMQQHSLRPTRTKLASVELRGQVGRVT